MNYISLCPGAGIGASGLTGHRCVLAVDNWKVAVESHRMNYPTVPCIRESVADAGLLDWAARDHAGIDVLMATPPCPGFHLRDDSDERNNVYLNCVDWIIRLKPKAAFIENVTGLLDSPFLPVARSRLAREGYQTAVWPLNAADYGTPQHRRRVILTAIPEGCGMPQPPAPTYGAGRKEFRTIRDALFGMSRNEIMRLDCDKISPMRAKVMRAVPAGGNWENLVGWRQVHAFQSVKGNPSYRLCRRYAWNETPETILTGVNIKGTTFPLHPSEKENRPFSVTEILRLMGVERRDFELAGSLKDRYMQAGNGLPPQLAAAVFETLTMKGRPDGSFKKR